MPRVSSSLLVTLPVVVAVLSHSARAIPPDFVRQGRLPAAEIQVQFGQQSVLIGSTLDVSNVALQYDDGSVQRFEGLRGKVLEIGGTGMHVGKGIARVWVKAGPNLSGWGPGFGQLFVRPTAPPKPAVNKNRAEQKRTHTAAK